MSKLPDYQKSLVDATNVAKGQDLLGKFSQDLERRKNAALREDFEAICLVLKEQGDSAALEELDRILKEQGDGAALEIGKRMLRERGIPNPSGG